MIRPLTAILALIAAVGASCEPAADTTTTAERASGANVLWKVPGESNSVYLLGSVHLLRETDYPLPAAYEAVYADAEKLFMELDMDDIDMVAIAQSMLNAGMIVDGSSMPALLGEERWEQAREMAASLDLELERLAALEPWFAALTVIELQMLKLGFDPKLGVEFHFLERARNDAKPIEGLETVDEQVSFFDNMPMETQSRFLVKTLEDAQDLESGIGTIISAWREGDLAALRGEMGKGFDGFPDVYDVLVLRRNQAWSKTIAALLDDEDDYLVIVGALHLVGPDSVVRMLHEMGYEPRRL